MTFIALAVGAYLLGSIPFGFLVGRWRGVDVLEIGSKSASSTNVSRALGWRWGAVSALLDFSKGFLPRISWGPLLVEPLADGGGRTAAHGWAGLSHLSSIQGREGSLHLLRSGACADWPPLLRLLRPHPAADLRGDEKTSLANLMFSWILVALMYIFLPLYCAIFAVAGAAFLTFALRGNIQRLLKGAEPDTPLKW